MTAPLQKRTQKTEKGERKKKKGLRRCTLSLGNFISFCIKVITANGNSLSRVVYVNDEMIIYDQLLPTWTTAV